MNCPVEMRSCSSVFSLQSNWLELFTQKVQEGEGEAESAHSEVKTQKPFLLTQTHLV